MIRKDFYQPHQHTSDNGTQIIVTPIPSARSVGISIYLKSGSRYEEHSEIAGISHFLEHICFKGTTNRPTPRDISFAIDSLGGTINAATYKEMTCYYAKVASEFTNQTLDLLLDMIQNSVCLDEEIERERGVILEELAAVQDTPSELASLLMDSLIWPNQPHGRDIAGDNESVSNISRSTIISAYHKQYVANNAIISIAGAIESNEAIELINEKINNWQPGQPNQWLPNRSLNNKRSGLISKDTGQTHIIVGMDSISSVNEQRYALDLLSICLGEGMSSRLFLRLREELGLCYDIHSYSTQLLDTGMFGIYAGVDSSNIEKTLANIRSELEKLSNPIENFELERAKSIMRSRIELSMENTRAVSAWYGTLATLEQQIIQPEKALENYEKVKPKDIQKLFQEIYLPDKTFLSIVGPLQSIEPFEEVLFD